MVVSKATIRDFNHKIIGFIETDEKGVKTARDFSLRILGTYDPKTNLTRDFYKRIVGRGDNLSMLFNTSSK